MGWSDTVGSNESQLATLGRNFAIITATPSVATVSVADGTTDDWTYGEFGVASYTFELGTQFFQQCSVFERTILPTNMPALIYAAKRPACPIKPPLGRTPSAWRWIRPIVAAGTLRQFKRRH
ncbi:MAG: hypothetical protein R2911_08880 [Caldilineaceae bacterium]